MNRGVAIVLVFTVIGAIACGLDWLVQGRVSREFFLWLSTIAVGLLLAQVHEFFEEIRNNTREIKEQNEKLTKQLDGARKSLHDEFSVQIEESCARLQRMLDRFEERLTDRLKTIENRLPPESLHEFFPELNGVRAGLERLDKIERDIQRMNQ